MSAWRHALQYSVRTQDDRAGGKRWRDNCRALYDYLRRDMRDAREERIRLYPDSGAQHVLCPVPFVWRASRELATLYLRSPARPTLPESAVPIYRGAAVNRWLRGAQEQVVALGNATLWVWPAEEIGGVRLFLAPPHEQYVQQRRMTSTHEADVETWWVRLPVRSDPELGLVEYGVAEITPTTAVWVEGPSDKVGTGVWREDETNPLGMIPVVMLRATDPSPGEWWAPVPEDLLQVQRALVHSLTDQHEIGRRQGFAQAVVRGMQQQDKLEIGADKAVLVSEEGDFKFESPSPDLDGLVKVSENYTRVAIAHLGLNPATFLKSSGITALAKQIELIDRDVERQRHVVEFRRGEQRLYDVIRAWVNYLRDGEILPAAQIDVEYREAVIPADPLHSAQSLQLEIEMGLTSAASELARREAISVEEAEAKVAAERERTAALGGVTMPDPTVTVMGAA